MSLASSFYTALSGLDTHAAAMQVVGDNVSNLNTNGFKTSSILFEDVLGSSLGGDFGGNQAGVGAKISSVDGNFTQGSLMTTGVGTDIAISGEGFFIAEEPDTDEQYYTRAGHFSLDNQGYYVNSQGLRVQGYLYDSTGTNLIETLTDIRVDPQSMVPPNATSAVDMVINLDATETATTWNIANPGGTSHYSTAVNIYDTLGQSHNIQLYFTKTADLAWDWNAVIDGSDVQGGTSGTATLFGSGSLLFDTSGQMTSAMPVNLSTGAITFANGIAASATTLDLAGTTQYGSSSAIQNVTQDGFAAGSLSGFSISSEGIISGNFTNGTVRNIAQIGLADFTNLFGLERDGSMLYRATSESGDPLYNRPTVGGLGSISSSMLEESNVDLASEFIRMMILQRGFQANSKVITTTDEMLAQLISIK
jgi:flagellar hook protein FlgE